MKLTVLVKNNEEILYFKNPLTITKSSHMTLKSATIYWDYNNVNDTENYVSVDMKKLYFDHGYWTFDAITKKLAEKGVTLTAHKETGKCTVTSVKSLDLRTFGELLGFRKGTTLTAGETKESYSMVNIHRGTRSVNVSCNIVDRSRNVDQEGNYSDVVARIPLPTADRPLKGTLSHHNDINSRVYLDNGVYSSLRFNVSTNTGSTKTIGEVLLELYIE